MREKPKLPHGLFKGLLTLALASSPSIYAQDDTDEDEIYELSPFTVDASDDEGYQTTNTLSGTRLNTENRYVGASVTEVTQQLLEDLAVDNFEDVLNYVPNSAPAESGGLTADPTGNEQIFGVRYRVRGFLLTGFSRDFFKTRVAPDSYNTERMSFSRGPNSVLFGIAEPGGVTNAVSSRAAWENSNSIGMRFDTWDSTRYDANFNRVLLEDKLALRVATVYDDHRNHRNPWHNKSERYYGAVTFKPFENTTLRAHHEWGDAERLNVRSWAPSDGITPWIAAGSQPIPDDVLNMTYPYFLSNPDVFRNRLNEVMAERGMREVPQGRSVLNGNPWAVMATGDVDESYTYQGWYTLGTGQNNVPGFFQETNGGISFTDDSVLPMTSNVLANGNKNTQEFSNTTVTFEQKFTENLFLEVAFNRQDTDNTPDFSMGSRDHVYLDILPTLHTVDPANPLSWWTIGSGTEANPNVGKYYTFNDTPVIFDHNYDDETVRAMLSYELDLRDRFDGKLGTILGHHNFAVMYEENDVGFVDRQFWLKNAMTSPETTDLSHGSGWIAIKNYIDIENGQYKVPEFASMYPRVWEENASDLPEANTTFVAPFWLGRFGTNTFSETTTEMFAMQNFFWDKKIVTTFGWREDDLDSWSVGANFDPATGLSTNVKRIDPRTGNAVSAGGSTNSKGIVITPIPWLGVFYNESSNFNPASAEKVDIFGNGIGNETGEGKDYGFKFHLMDGKLTGSLAWFETNFLNQATGGPRVGPVAPFDPPRATTRWALEQYYAALTPDDLAAWTSERQAAGLGAPEDFEFWRQHGQFNWDVYQATQDFSSEGWELSLTANPTPNWRMTFNLSKQENVSSNVAPEMRKWAVHIRDLIEDDYPEFLPFLTDTVGADGNRNTIAEQLDLFDRHIVEIASLEGFSDQRQPELSANFVTGYDFQEGPFKKFSVGGSYRWRDRAVVGYTYADDGSGALDATNPYWNDDTHWVGLFVKYRTTISDGVDMQLQLNVDNAFDSDSLNPLLSRQVNGQRFDSRWILPEGRSFALSAKFDF
ncbi:TonB-dependent siderophore receptor [Pelagicoccus mobilis]|uniref:TonB-dependent receptor plug domain-containing protein n=1 Tax=Pelagicoccus mobilis TaxID=415221 RepID=A0A934S3K9_9BACT|nr:TonB-dependent receptor plug domain-containing protein [Pelagicoccus mobilis]MBK1880051.1 TonB-dependent receptor plug domain-containing protein [Pelagicoccus mobilis]